MSYIFCGGVQYDGAEGHAQFGGLPTRGAVQSGGSGTSEQEHESGLISLPTGHVLLQTQAGGAPVRPLGHWPGTMTGGGGLGFL